MITKKAGIEWIPNEHGGRSKPSPARLDDLANFVPARLSRLLFSVAAWICGFDGAGCWRIVRRDGHNSPSPNAGIPEAAVAGALRVQLGG